MVFRTLTLVEMFEVEAAPWKHYLKRLSTMQDEYILSFIRLNLGINLNFSQRVRKSMDMTETKENHSSPTDTPP